MSDPNEFIARYKSVRQRTVAHCEHLSVEDHVPQPAEFVSPPKWHLAHTTWFFEEFILKNHTANYRVFHPDFSFMFNSYYNTVGTRVMRADRGNMTRPSLSKVHEYRKYVDEHIVALLGNEMNEDLMKLFQIGINHEQQHQELLLTDLKYILGNNPLFPVYKADGALCLGKNSEHGWVTIDPGQYSIGAEDDGFSYDNEHNRHTVYLTGGEISKSLVTNGEFLAFINDGGYIRHELWLDEGWAWVNEQNVSSPLYWHLINDSWHHFTLGGLQLIDPDCILSHVSHYEAAAFAEWKGMRLPTEFEWEAVSDKIFWGQRWEHTNSAYLAYPGFKKPEGAVGEYNGKFMMNQMVLRGASVATSGNHSRKSYRNFFHPHLQWQFSGIRLAKDE